MDQLTQEGNTVHLLATNTWSCDHLQTAYEEAVAQISTSYPDWVMSEKNKVTKFMSLDRTIEQAETTRERFNLDEAQLCGKMLTLRSGSSELASADVKDARWLKRYVESTLTTETQNEMHQVRSLAALDQLN